MGLDMYLTGRVSTKNWNFNKDKEKFSVIVGKVQSNGMGCRELPLPEITSVSFEAGYWRKANAIHGWMVENVQNGEDNCAEYWISMDNLLDLKELCETVLTALENSPKGTIEYKMGWGPDGDIMGTKEVYILNDDAVESLPPTKGFFFGSHDVDDWYVQDLKSTIEIVEQCLKYSDEVDGEINFYYQASW
jgi:hypothetical protein